MTTADELIAAGRAMTKPCVLLRRGDGEPWGYWGGSRADLPNRGRCEVPTKPVRGTSSPSVNPRSPRRG